MNQGNKMSDKIIKKNQFQIRKVPLKRFPPQKVPELYALDIHSICLPKKDAKRLDWVSSNYDIDNLQTQQTTQRIVESSLYRQLYTEYVQMREEKRKQKQRLQQEIDSIENKIQNEKQQKSRLTSIRDQFYGQIQTLREQLTQCRNKSYNLRWEIYHQRGTYYFNPNHYSFLENNADPTYEDYLMLEEQIGSVSKGLNEIELALLPKVKYLPIRNQQSIQKTNTNNNMNEGNSGLNEPNPESLQQEEYTKQICCICYDDINEGEYITILKCNHFQHCDCIKDWLAKQKNCPICKKEVNVDEFHLNKKQNKLPQDHGE